MNVNRCVWWLPLLLLFLPPVWAQSTWHSLNPSIEVVSQLSLDRPTVAITQIDKLLSAETTTKSQRAELLLVKAWALYYAGHWELVASTLTQGMALTDAKSLLLQYYRLAQANFYSAVGETQQAFSQLDAVGQYLKFFPHSELQRYHLQIAAQLHQDAEDYDMALYFYLKLLDELSALSTPTKALFDADRGTVLRGLAFVYYMLDDKELSSHYLDTAAKFEPPSHQVAHADIDCMRGYQLQNSDAATAKQALLQVLTRAKAQRELYCSPLASAVLSQVYMHERNWVAALDIAEQASQLVNRHNPDLYLYAWYNLGYLYLQLQRLPDASRVITHLEQLVTTLPANVNHSGLLYLQAEYAKTRGDFQQALALTQQYYQQQLSANAESNIRNIARYRYLYDQEKNMAQSNNLLLQNELSEVALKNQVINQRLYLAGIAVLLSLVLVIWLLYRRARIWQQQAVLLQQIDVLTQLPNQQYLALQLPQLVAMANRYHFEIAVVALELDELAGLEREFGAETTELLIKEFAALCRQHVRETDQLARAGTGHFAMVLPYTDTAACFSVLSKLQTECALALSPLLTKPYKVSFSAGIQFSSQQADAALLVLEAERALALAKHQGKAQITRFML